MRATQKRTGIGAEYRVKAPMDSINQPNFLSTPDPVSVNHAHERSIKAGIHPWTAMTRYFLRGITQPLAYDLHSGLNTIGRNPTNDFRIPEASVSSFHCELDVTEAGVFVRDLQSTNGTFINEHPVEQAQLLPDQVLQLGTVTLRMTAAEVEINIPKVPEKPSEPDPKPVLPDGRPACRKNPQIPATHRCTKCESTYHVSCVRGMRVAGGVSAHLFCPECDGPCLPIAGALESSKNDSFLGRLTQTVLLGWRKK